MIYLDTYSSKVGNSIEAQNQLRSKVVLAAELDRIYLKFVVVKMDATCKVRIKTF